MCVSIFWGKKKIWKFFFHFDFIYLLIYLSIFVSSFSDSGFVWEWEEIYLVWFADTVVLIQDRSISNLGPSSQPNMSIAGFDWNGWIFIRN